MSEENKTIEIKEEDLKKVAGGEDIDSLKFSGKAVPLPEAKPKKECDGGYTGNITSKTATDITVS